MHRQKSDQDEGGKLYLVGTPIGNLGDMSTRALEVLRSCDLIAAEDTRQTRKLLSHFQFSVPMVSYHEHNEHKQLPTLIARLRDGQKIALVSDAGMPAISDPGESLVKAAIAEEIAVIPIPGANAALSALVASGLSVQPFLFVGFLPRQTSKRKRALQSYREIPATLIFYESPYRVEKLLLEIGEVLGERQVAVVRELTKKHEEWLRGNVSDCLQVLAETGTRGEYTLIVEGFQATHVTEEASSTALVKEVERYVAQGCSPKEAIQEVAQKYQQPKREVYNAYHQHQNSEEKMPLADD